MTKRVVARRSVGKSGRSERGQSMVEFMMVISVIFLVFLSMMQLMLLMHAYNTLADAAKEGVRYAIVHGTGMGASACSGPGSVTLTPAVTCTDANGANVVTAVANFAGVSFQSIGTTNNKCNTATAGSINVCYDPNSANTNNTVFGKKCSQPGCVVKVTVQQTYSPLFGWGPSITLNAAADGVIAN
jgi:hypothetical protein